MKSIAAILLFATATFAFAQADECVQYRAQYNGRTTGWVATPAAACSALNGGYPAGGNATSDVVTNSRPDPSNPAVCLLDRAITYQGGTTVNGGGTAPLESQTTPGQCTDLCKAKQGRETTVNWTIGYSRYADENHPNAYDLISKPNLVPKDGSMCLDGCKVVAEYGNATSTAYRSKEPTPQGTYRLSIDYNAQHLGSSCTAAPEDKPADPNDEIPPCKGSVGTVNGKPHCAGTAANPVRNDTPTDKPANGEEGNPRAGEKPGSGEGSGSGGAGRTPSQGNGGPGGGPASAAGDGEGPDGNTDEPGEGKEQQACGAPGQPKCRIDETGTPDGKNAFGEHDSGLTKAKDGVIEDLRKWADKKADGWTWTFQLPSGCSPVALAGYDLSIDVCQFQPVIHDIMSMVWAIATVMGCCLLVFHAQGK